MRSILSDIIPFAKILIYSSMADYKAASPDIEPFHFFIGSESARSDKDFFLDQRRKTIVMTTSSSEEEEVSASGFRTISAYGPEDEVIKSLLKIHQSAHSGGYHGFERNIGEPSKVHPITMNQLSEREKEVLVLVVKGFINKEIADLLNVAVTTIISHRKNISEKLDIKSPGKLAIYAVLNRLVSIDEIGMHI